MKNIKLNTGQIAIVDDEDFEWLNKCKWYFGSHKYAGRGKYLKRMHVDIMKKHNLYKNGLEVDHINRNGLDNRKCNLRMCTNAQNSANSAIRKHNTSGYKGVSWSKWNKKWGCSIGFNYKHLHIGYFRDKIEAALAYNKKAKELFGEFAYQNIVSQ